MQHWFVICGFLNFEEKNISNPLYCPYGDDAGCLALLNATLVALPKAGFNRVKFLVTEFLKGNYLRGRGIFYPASSIQYPVSCPSAF
jgi:hypothetical protein